MIIHSSNTDNNNNDLPLDNVNDLPLDNWERMGTRSNQHCGSRCPGEEHQAISTHSDPVRSLFHWATSLAWYQHMAFVGNR